MGNLNLTKMLQRFKEWLHRFTWGLPGLGDPARVFVATVAFHVAAIAAIAVVLDIAASSISSPLSEWSIGATQMQETPSLGERAATFLLGFVAFFPVLLLALTSFAVATTAAFGSPSLLLLHRRYRSWESPTVLLHGRTNRFHRSLVFGLGLIAALLALTASRQLNLSGNHLPALLFVGVLLLCAGLSALVLAVWLIQLRNPSDVVREIHGMAHDVIAEITAGHPHAHLSRLIRYDGELGTSLYLSFINPHRPRYCSRGLQVFQAHGPNQGNAAGQIHHDNRTLLGFFWTREGFEGKPLVH